MIGTITKRLRRDGTSAWGYSFFAGRAPDGKRIQITFSSLRCHATWKTAARSRAASRPISTASRRLVIACGAFRCNSDDMQFTFAQTTRQVELLDEFYEWSVAAQSGMMDANELLHLAAALTSYDWKQGGFVVEIGAYWGSTSAFMAKVLHRLSVRVPILSIDPFERFQADPLNPSGVFSIYTENVRSAGFADLCLPLVAFSADAAPVVAPNIGVLVIDGGVTARMF